MFGHRRVRLLAVACAVVLGVGAITGFSGLGRDPTPVGDRAAGPVRTAATNGGRDDVEAASSSPLPAGARRGPAAPAPRRAGARGVAERASFREQEERYSISPGAPSDAEVRAELKAMKAAQRDVMQGAPVGGPPGEIVLTKNGNARIPANAPKKVAAIVSSANAIARFPYVYGGGHGSFVDSAYDCSGSISYALAGAGLMDAPLASGAFETWGEPGPGKWVTIYANPGHMFMTVAGVRYDTSGRSGVLGSRWNATPRSLEGFTVRHPKGL